VSITASVTGTRISASVSGAGVSATVGSGVVSAAVTGGIGPQGPSGDTGDVGGATTLSELTDVQITAAADGDVLRYSTGKWRDYAEINLVDGGNFAWLIASVSAGLQALALLSTC
jgi:hypothetical protein